MGRIITNILLLFCFVSAQAQPAAMFHAHNQTAAQATYSPVLDTYGSAAFAYSTHKVRSAYSGSCLRVRRTADNTEQDIGFLGNYLDTVSLKSFVSSTDSGFVVKWYDQSGNARDLAQTTTTKAPRIIKNGVVERDGNKISLYWRTSRDGGIATQEMELSFANIPQPISYFIVFNRVALSNNVSPLVLWDAFTSTQHIYYVGGQLTASTQAAAGTGYTSTTTQNNGVTHLNYVLFNGSSSAIQADNNTIESGKNFGTNGLAGLTLGNVRANLSQWGWMGYMTELIGYNANQSTNKDNIRSIINTNYSIY